MRKGIHPEYKDVTFSCACGATHNSRSTSQKSAVAICSSCHPFFTGKQKFVDTAGRVEKFMKKYAKVSEQEAAAKAAAAPAKKGKK